MNYTKFLQEHILKTNAVGTMTRILEMGYSEVNSTRLKKAKQQLKDAMDYIEEAIDLY